MVASSVYGFEDGLTQIVGTLRTYGYAVWNSQAGTIPTDPLKSNLEICLDAVRKCDVFVGLIRQFYGSGIVGETSITHEEMRLAVALNKPRWILAHEQVILARQLLRPFLPYFSRPGMLSTPGAPSLPPLPSLRHNPVIDDIRILDLYAELTRTDLPLEARTGHWIQPYRNLGDVLRYVETNLGNVAFVRDIVENSQRILS